MDDILKTINKADFLFLNSIRDTDPNGVYISVTIGEKSSEPLSIPDPKDPVDKILNGAYEITKDENSPEYIIFFDNYVSYTVTNESNADAEEVSYTGNRFRNYTKSLLMEYVKNRCFLIYDSENVKHYAILTETHIIDVITTNEPAVHIKEKHK